MKQRIRRWFPSEYSYSYDYQLSPWHRRRVTVRGGDITWWQSLIEDVVSLTVMVFATTMFARWLDPAFGVIWMFLVGIAWAFSKQLQLRLFPRHDRRTETVDELIGEAPTREQCEEWDEARRLYREKAGIAS